jgi:2'-5' RNA ligase
LTRLSIWAEPEGGDEAMVAPLILTLALEDHAFQYFNSLRRAHFPPERNFIDAHLTLLHQLPNTAANLRKITAISERIAPFRCKVSSLMKLGNGVAFRIISDDLCQLHHAIIDSFREDIIAQDKQPFRPHITIQNKVSPANAQILFDDLSSSFKPWEFDAVGLFVWEYQNGPWSRVSGIPFS